MVQKTYHIIDFTDGSFEKMLEEVSAFPAYRTAGQVLLLVFEQNWDTKEINRKTHLIGERLPKAEIIGTTHFDELFWGGEISNKSIFTFLFFEERSFSVEKMSIGETSERETGRKMNESFHTREGLKGVLVFLSEYRKNIDVLLEEAGRDLPDIPIFGGTALLYMDRQDSTESYVFDGEDCYEDMILSVLFYGNHLHLKVSYNYGWTPIGKKMTITKMDGDFRVLEIDHRPALEIYGKYLGLPEAELIQIPNICEFPLIVKRGDLTIARVPTEADKEGAIHFAATVKEGDEVRFSYGAQLRIFSEIYNDSKNFAAFGVQGMFLVICMNRVIFLKNEEKYEVKYYRQVMPETAFLHGNSEIYYCNGEGGELNSALVAVGIREGEAEKIEVELDKDILREEQVKNDLLIPLEYRVMNFMNAVTGDLEEMTKRANAANEAKSAFLSSMSHEIRTPINAVLGMDEMILRESGEEQILEYAENIRTAGNTLLNLINDVLDFSKIEAGKMELVESEYETASVFHDLVTMISMRAENKGLALETKINPGMPSLLYGDEIRIKQVVTNILTNAVKYTEKGTVTLSADFEKKDEEHILISVSVKDTGIGIKEEDIEKLFSAFERIEEERNRNIEGTGLGMNITNRLLDMMGSRLSVDSVYGEGSDFSFVLEQKVLSWEPVGDMETSWKESVKSRNNYQSGFTAQDARILAVDDTAMNLTVLQGLLKPTKIQIDTASSGPECLDMITKKKYDLIFLDHRMPEMDGIETKERMSGLAGNQNAETPVVALTANAVSGAREEYIRHGFTDYLTKPIDTKDMENMLKKYLPEEKIQAAVLQDISGEENDQHLEEELSSIDGLDLSFAKLHLPTAELLFTAMKDYYAVIELHADRLDEMYERLPEKQVFSDYRIQVHGMKSSAAIIGIVPLAGMAKVLEDAAGREDSETITNLHGTFSGLWREYKERLSLISGLAEKKGGDEEKLPFEKEVFEGLLETLRSSMEEFDLDRADETMALIEKYAYPEELDKEIEKLKAAVSDVDSDGVVEMIDIVHTCV